MSDLKDGRYWIQNAWFHRVRLGLEDGTPESDYPLVVVWGRYTEFYLKKVGEHEYTLTVKEESGRIKYIQEQGDSVIGNDDPPPTVWSITRKKGFNYTIEVPSPIFPTLGWTLPPHGSEQPPSGAPISLTYVLANPTYDQLWDFTYLGPAE